MDRIDYWKFQGFENLYLEDSHLLDLHTDSQVEARVEAVLRESHPDYHGPKPGEQYAYKNIVIAFPNLRNYRWLEKKMVPTRDPDGGIDYGNIDEFYRSNERYFMSGDWGTIEIDSDPPIVRYLEAAGDNQPASIKKA